MSQKHGLTSVTQVRMPTATMLHTHVNGSMHILVRLAWLFLAAAMVILFIIGTPAHFQEMRTASDKPGDPFYRLTTHEERTLAELGLSNDLYAIWLNGADMLFMISFTVIAGVIFWRRSDDWMAILLSLSIIMTGTTYGQAVDSLARAEPLWTIPTNFMKGLGWAISLWLLFLFPTGQFVPRWTRYAAIFWTVWMLLWPFVPSLDPFQLPRPFGTLVFVIAYTLGIYAQRQRYVRLSGPVQRQQTQWIVFAIAITVLGFASYQLLPVAFPLFAQNGLPRLLYNLISIPTVVFGTALMIPLSIGISIFRYKLYNIDFVINRGLVIGGLTIILGLIFLGSVFVLQTAFQAVTNSQQSTLAVAASALVIGTVFQPARHRLQRFIDRRFYGIKVNVKPAFSSMSPLINAPGDETQQFGPYRVKALIGRGGMGEVYRGYHPTLNRDVAIKVLSASTTLDPEAPRRFEREAQAVAQLRHRNIVQMFDVGEVNGIPYMVMEYIPGEDLSTRLRNNHPMTLVEALPVVRDVAAALDYAHEMGMVHRDIKPSNIMLCPDTSGQSGYRAVLMDFGIVKLQSSAQTGLTGTSVVGTADYIAPEQIRGEALDRRADVYSLGIVVYEMLTGKKPFESSTMWNLLMAHLQRPVPDPRDLAPQLSETAALAIMRALGKEPDDRYPTAGAFAEALGG